MGVSGKHIVQTYFYSKHKHLRVILHYNNFLDMTYNDTVQDLMYIIPPQCKHLALEERLSLSFC